MLSLLLLSACGLNPFAEDKPATLAVSAAAASLQTYGALMAAERPEALAPAAGRDESRPAASARVGAGRQVAALPRADEPQIAVRVLFPPGKGALSAEDEADLKALAAQLLREERPPIEILAYWSGGEEAAAMAKRRAVKRAILVRSRLMAEGIETAPIVFT
ncbi:MAG: hypothetical protein MI920_09630, partial [Kiloniellales bacterium]|nr:hypothetical protein [Kiloniellales bacterium]